MSRTFVISDTHFGHFNILKFENAHRPFSNIDEHDECLIDKWNAVVRHNDVVWHLGDVLFGKHKFPLLERLNGTKHLVLGNHDHYPLALYQQYFKKIKPYHIVNGCILSHIPVHPNQLAFRFKRNIHGHMHSHSIADERYTNVSVECTNLEPRLLSEIVN